MNLFGLFGGRRYHRGYGFGGFGRRPTSHRGYYAGGGGLLGLLFTLFQVRRFFRNRSLNQTV